MNTSEITKRKVCIEEDCQQEFEITRGELDWLASRGFEEYKRCPDCRNKRKLKKLEGK